MKTIIDELFHLFQVSSRQLYARSMKCVIAEPTIDMLSVESLFVIKKGRQIELTSDYYHEDSSLFRFNEGFVVYTRRSADKSE